MAVLALPSVVSMVSASSKLNGQNSELVNRMPRPNCLKLLSRWMMTYAAFARALSRASSYVAGLLVGSERGSSRAELRIKANSEVT